MTKEEISARQQQAAQFHAMGYNCAQSVACAFADKVDLDKVALFKVTEGLGLGMGGMNGTCGAISAAAVLAGLKDSTGDLELANSKAVSYKDARECIARFLEKNQSVVCRDLKGVETGNVLRACPDCISDAAALNTICQEMADSGVDLIATIATPATQAMVNLETDIPVFFIAVSNPVGAGVITDMEKPDKNATGTSNAIPVEDIFALSDKLTPDCKTYGMLYNTSEINSVSTVENAKKYLDDQGLSYKEAVVTNSSEVQQAAQSLAGEVDAIFVPNDSVIQSAMPMVTEVARDAKIPVYGSSAVMVDSGAFATIAISDTEIGAQTADMALEYLNGTAMEDIAAVVVPASNMVINQDTADALEITFSDEVQSEATFVKDAE